MHATITADGGRSAITLTPGSPSWWAALAEMAAVLAEAAWIIGDRAESRKWLGVAADCSVALCSAQRAPAR
jgi:hypothetical protein